MRVIGAAIALFPVLLAASLAIAAGSGVVVLRSPIKGSVSIRFQQAQPDGTVRELGRTGCYDFEKVKVTVEACKP